MAKKNTAKNKEMRAKKAAKGNTLGKVFKKNVPWAWLIGNFLFSMCMGYFYIELPDITAQIGAGKIFDSELITRFILLSVIQTFCVVLATISSKLVGYFIERTSEGPSGKSSFIFP